MSPSRVMICVIDCKYAIKKPTNDCSKRVLLYFTALPIEHDHVIHSFLHRSLCGSVMCPDFGVRGLQFGISTSSHSWLYQDEFFNVQTPQFSQLEN